MTTKKLSGFQIKDAKLGIVTAVFSRTVDSVESAKASDIDFDGDVVLKGAFTEGQAVVISAYGHKSWDGALPYGTGTIKEVGNEVVFEGQFVMDTPHGADAFAVVAAVSKAGLQEWSYSLHDVDAVPVKVAGRSVRLLKKIDVKEVSPVLRGAGVDTHTVSTKDAGDIDPIARHKQLAGEIWDMLNEAGRQRWNSGSMYAYVYVSDYDADLGFVVFNVAQNGATREIQLDFTRTDTSVTLGEVETEVVSTTVFVPKSADMKLAEHLAAVMTAVDSAVGRTADVMALRAEKGKSVSTGAADLLRGVKARVERIAGVLASHDVPTPSESNEGAKRAYLEFLRTESTHNNG